MPRFPRIVIPGAPHHVTQRGNNRLDVFFVDEDRRVYLALLKKHGAEHGLNIQGYCLMTNHIHLVATPQQEDSLAKALGCTHFGYAQYINHLHRRSGHLWQNRFFSCPLDDRHCLAALRYIERNPVRAKMTRHAWDYPWSSAQAHMGSPDSSALLDLNAWQTFLQGADWKELLQKSEDEALLHAIRLHTRTGRPLASDSFISKIETLIGRRLRPLPIGRPPKMPPIKAENELNGIKK